MKSVILFLILNFVSNVLSSKYSIKYLTTFTEYPVRLVDNFGSYESTNTILEKSKWLKHGSKCFVEDLSSKYFSTEINSNGGVNLLLLNYDTKTNMILDHYEPYHYKDGEMQQTNEIYTLVFLKSFDLKINETENEIKASCELTLSIPIGITDEHTVIIDENLEETIHLEIGYDGETQYKKDSRSKNSKHNHKRNLHSKRSVNSQPSIFEKTYSTGSIDLNKYTFESDQKSVNITCNLILRDFDNSHAFDTSLIKTINLGKNDMSRPVVGQSLNGAHKFDFGLLNFLSFLIASSFLTIYRL